VAAEDAVNGEDAMVTVLFVDIRDFTRLADSSTAREAVALLNEFFGVVVPALEADGRRAQQFLGDGLLGVSDSVNVAARVEQATRRTGDSVLVTEATCCLTERDGLVPRGTLELKGKTEPVAVYALGAAR
jgi:class 3 adenylate cyclase